jgi:hypothetical protein
MDITWKMGDLNEVTHQRRLARITITFTPEDDPHGYLVGLVWNKRLEAFLRVFAKPAEWGATGYSEQEFRDLLNAAGYVDYHFRGRLEGMMLAARDQYGMGWGTIAATLERPRQTVRDQIRAIRRDFARQGSWYDSSGFHHGGGRDALEVCAGTERHEEAVDG